MDYPVQLVSQLQQLLKSLRKSRQLTQAELARRLGVVQSRVADIERDPGAVSVEQLLQVLAMLGAQVVVRQTDTGLSAAKPSIDLEALARAKATVTAFLGQGSSDDAAAAAAAAAAPRPVTLEDTSVALLDVYMPEPKAAASAPVAPPEGPHDDEPRGQW